MATRAGTVTAACPGNRQASRLTSASVSRGLKSPQRIDDASASTSSRLNPVAGGGGHRRAGRDEEAGLLAYRPPPSQY